MPVARWLGRLALVMLCLLAGAVGGFVMRRVGSAQESIPYADFITIMLTAVSALVTTLAVFLAILGVIGWNSIRGNISDRTTAFLEDGFQKGNPLYEMIRERTTEIMYQGVSPISEDEDGPISESERNA